VLSATHGARGVGELLTQLLQIAGEGGFSRVGEVAAAQPIRTALHAGAEVAFVHAINRAAQLSGSRRLGRRELARTSTNLLGEARQVVGHLLAIIDHFVDILGGQRLRLLARCASGRLLRYQVAHAICLLFLPGRQLFGRLSH
jgi:hypothetical protein